MATQVDTLIAGLENAKFSVSAKRGNYGRADVMEISYKWQGGRIIAGDIVITKQEISLLSYPTLRRGEMEGVAEAAHVKVVKDVTAFRAVETYLGLKSWITTSF